MMDVLELALLAAPLLMQPVPPPPTLDAELLAAIMGHDLAHDQLAAWMQIQLEKPPISHVPRPSQAGDRIMDEWLLSLTDEECLWRFR